MSADRLSITKRMEALAPTSELGILFADVAGSMRLYESLGDTAAKAAIDECLAVISDVAATHHGWVIKTIGDEAMCAFRDPADVCAAAIAMQEKIAVMPPILALNEGEDAVHRMIRIGFHFGPVLETATDVFGDTVNVAARLAEIARGNQIITSKQTVLRLPPPLRHAARDIAAMVVKSSLNNAQGGDLPVAEILWDAGTDLTQTTPAFVRSRNAALTLTFGERSVELDAASASVTVGRDPRCAFILHNSKVSRIHAKIEFRRGQFYLVDQSTNGTTIAFAGESELSLRREETMLRGSGTIVCGHHDLAAKSSKTERAAAAAPGGVWSRTRRADADARAALDSVTGQGALSAGDAAEPIFFTVRG